MTDMKRTFVLTTFLLLILTTAGAQSIWDKTHLAQVKEGLGQAAYAAGAPLPAREEGEKGAREGKPRRVFCLRGIAAKTGTSLFPHGACFIESFTLSIA